MTDLVLLTRDPATAPNRPNWIVATQETFEGQTASWRSTIWGKGKFAVKGTSMVEVEDGMDAYVASRLKTGYVEQVRIKIYFPMTKVVAFIAKTLKENQDKIMSLAKMAGLS